MPEIPGLVLTTALITVYNYTCPECGLLEIVTSRPSLRDWLLQHESKRPPKGMSPCQQKIMEDGYGQ